MKTEETRSGDVADGASELELLRKLVLGSVVADYQKQVGALRDRLAEAESGLRAERDKLRSVVDEALARVGSGLEETRVVKESVLEHNQMLRTLAESMKDVEKNFADLHAEMSTSFDGIRAEHSLLTSFVYGELQSRMAALENASMSGVDLSEMLVELAGRVRQSRTPSMASMHDAGGFAMPPLGAMPSYPTPAEITAPPQPVPSAVPGPNGKVEEADIDILDPDS